MGQPIELAIRRKAFDGGGDVLRDLDLSLERGSYVCFMGASGCGKSTLLRIIGGLDRKYEGSVRVGGSLVKRPAPDRAFVFQEALLLDWKSVLANVMFAVDGDFSAAQKASRAREALKLVGMPDVESFLPRQLSGGMAKRVALARALAARPSVLLMDEPFSALDFHARVGLQEIIESIHGEDRFTALHVTHDVDEAVALADRIVLLGGQPSKVVGDLKVDLPRRRDRVGGAFQDVRDELVTTLLEAVDSRATGAQGLSRS